MPEMEGFVENIARYWVGNGRCFSNWPYSQ